MKDPPRGINLCFTHHESQKLKFDQSCSKLQRKGENMFYFGETWGICMIILTHSLIVFTEAILKYFMYTH